MFGGLNYSLYLCSRISEKRVSIREALSFQITCKHY